MSHITNYLHFYYSSYDVYIDTYIDVYINYKCITVPIDIG